MPQNCIFIIEIWDVRHGEVELDIFSEARVPFCADVPADGIKAGEILCEQGDIRTAHYGKSLHIAPSYDLGLETDIAAWFEQYYSIGFRNYPVDKDNMFDPLEIACEPS